MPPLTLNKTDHKKDESVTSCLLTTFGCLTDPWIRRRHYPNCSTSRPYLVSERGWIAR